MIRKYFGIKAICCLSICLTSDLISQGVSEDGGILKLCPSGGKSFTTVWHLACVARKKRSATSQGKLNPEQSIYRPLSIIEMMDYCCNVGCKIQDLFPYCDPFQGCITNRGFHGRINAFVRSATIRQRSERQDPVFLRVPFTEHLTKNRFA
uniref:Insulin-like domain-containing protein n=1 Tax=Setaria digitata TaxID=48799 RepID=A0A915PUG6_9BILA